MTIHVLPVFSDLELLLVILLEKLDVQVVFPGDADGKYLHPKEQIDTDDFIVRQFNGSQGIMSMIELVNASK
jgi:hypothetical protein